MTANPVEVSLTSRGSAVVQRVIAGVSIAGVVASMVALAFSGQPVWAILLWELGLLLVVVLIMLAIWGVAGDSAKETAAPAAAGTQVLGELTDETVHDSGEDVHHDLTLWIPLPQGGSRSRTGVRVPSAPRVGPERRSPCWSTPRCAPGRSCTDSRTWGVRH